MIEAVYIYLGVLVGTLLIGSIVLIAVMLTLYLTMPKIAFEEMKRRFHHWDGSAKKLVPIPWFYENCSKWSWMHLSVPFFLFCVGTAGLKRPIQFRFGGFDFKPLLTRSYCILTKVFVAAILLNGTSLVLMIPAYIYLEWIAKVS